MLINTLYGFDAFKLSQEISKNYMFEFFYKVN